MASAKTSSVSSKMVAKAIIDSEKSKMAAKRKVKKSNEDISPGNSRKKKLTAAVSIEVFPRLPDKSGKEKKKKIKKKLTPTKTPVDENSSDSDSELDSERFSSGSEMEVEGASRIKTQKKTATVTSIEQINFEQNNNDTDEQKKVRVQRLKKVSESISQK
ncbi:hypothetical protein K0M31_012051 [Melipona bicolor]|uniref:Uncharacterized protein n=1 Tax=Melipona bicolor TaxID=60889 RepID=A0AA40KVK9_9HYME|nr:hypothetical protein K0M31_012051 [Melipona bicolor]